MTDRDQAARDTFLHHHAELVDGVRARVTRLCTNVDAGEPHLPAWAELVAYLGGEILAHAAAEEDTIYPAAADAGLTGQVEAMVGEHRHLEQTVETLARTTDPADAVTTARHIEAMFTAHVTAENEVVLPALLTSDTSLADLLAAMHEAHEAARRGALRAYQPTDDLAGELTTLLTTALHALAEAGNSHHACRLAADAWAHQRDTRPDLAARTTALLHQLAGHDNPELTTDAAHDDGPELDVRALAPAHRHQIIFTTYQALQPSAGFVLVNDHDPKPLKYQFAAEHTGRYTWHYLQAGPRVWRVRIGKPASESPATNAQQDDERTPATARQTVAAAADD